MEPDNLCLDRYLLGLVGGATPKVCFVGTAGGDSLDYIDRFYEAFRSLGAEADHLAIFRKPKPRSDLRGFVLTNDIVYVGGGSSRNLLALWREWGLDTIFREAWERGVVLAGVSAGALCWFEQGVTDSMPGALDAIGALGLLPGSFCPHYDGEPERRPAYRRLLREGRIAAGYAADDGVALHFVDHRLARVVASRATGRAYRVEASPDGIQEIPLEPTRLDESGSA
jgi:peptidase E